MIIELHLCGPAGDVRRQQLTRILNELKEDNCFVIEAMINAGRHVPDTVIELGLNYEPARGAAKFNDRQPFYGMRKMIELGTFRCGDASAYEAAVMETKYGIPSMVLVVPQDTDDFHGVYVTDDGEAIDPTANWLEFQKSSVLPKSTRQLREVEQGSYCEITNGKVKCSGLEDHSGCCVTSSGHWSCPDGHPLNGVKADLRGRRTKGGQSWALVGPNRTTVPVCPGDKRR